MSETEPTFRRKTTREFNDAGTERNFEAATEYSFTPGEYRNFLAAGLIEKDETPVATAPAADTVEGSKAKTRG